MNLLKSIESDAAEFKNLKKAAVVNSTYTYSPTTQSLFNPINVDPKAKLVVPTSTPAVRMLPRVQSPGGQHAQWFKMTSPLDPSATGTNTDVFVADGGTPNETTQTYEHASASYKILARKLEIGLQQMESSYSGELNVQNQLLKIKMLEILRGEEWAIFNGDSSVQTNGFDGIAKQLTTYSGSENGGYITASGLQEYSLQLWEGGAEGDRIFFCNPRQHKALTDELYGTGSIQQINVQSAIASQANLVTRGSVTTVIGAQGETIKIVPSRDVGSVGYLITPTSYEGVNFVEMEDQMPMSLMDVPSTALSKTQFVVKMTVLKMIWEAAHYKIHGLSTT